MREEGEETRKSEKKERQREEVAGVQAQHEGRRKAFASSVVQTP